MTMYVYIKGPTKSVRQEKDRSVVKTTIPRLAKQYKISIKKKIAFKVLSILMVFGGLFSLGVVLVPLFYYQYVIGPSLTKTEFIRPVPVFAAQDEGGYDTDYSRASNWFPSAKPQVVNNSSVTSYTISIPKLKIKDVTSTVGAEDLNRSLIHYGGTGMPGEYGTGIVFGHSILPVFYDPGSYRAIFSTIHTLEIGDKIIVNYDGIEFTYIVYDKQIVDPTDFAILEQHFDNSYLNLVSCYPPGTYYKRLVVKTRLLRPE